MKPLSGDQYLIRAHGYEAEVAGIGATLRSLRYRGRDLVVPFGADVVRPAMRGALLAPWPNRTGDGRYEFAGASHELPLNEPEHRNASHGLAAWLDFRPVESTGDHVLLTGTIQPQPGYPWRVRLDVALHLGERGLMQRVTATNESAAAAPYGLGGHPYLVAGSARRGAVDGWSLHVPAETVLLADERRLPVRDVAVAQHAGGALDFRLARRIGTTVLDHAFTGLLPDPDGMTRVTLLDPDGHGVQLAVDSTCRWLQIYSADLQEGDDRRAGLAVEPMTCPPDALRSGRDLMVLEPGERVVTSWELSAVTC
ncbi:aldose 1-epimerase family protein [Cellulomonas endometrii]|uniref:aldose 1-epimerase family protein n=1 Tax=Cellulomonas endometrii TaxID=3036301 RepID=UPI0024AE239D|nr:aldose 1-epimerase family protein [Cellulomonas endometrii]